MYAGRTAEISAVDSIFTDSCHPYTRGLLGSLPKLDETNRQLLRPIPGAPPSMLLPPTGCAFHPRCPMAQPNCAIDVPDLRLVGGEGQLSACHYAEDLESVESATDLAEEMVDRAPPKAILAEEAAAALAELAPRKRVSALAVVTCLLGLAAPVLALALSDQDVTVRGGIVMLLGGAAVLVGRRALRGIDAGKGYLLGRMPAKIGFGLAWLAIAIWAFYCVLWLCASLLPEATP
jgi:oligopeptide/dipeptide ABC transporter ATP-binding protein